MEDARILHIEEVGGGVAEPCPGVVDVPVGEFPMPGAVKMTEHECMGIGEILFSEAGGTFTAGEPATDDVEGALRRPETMQQPPQVFVANAFAAQDGRGEPAHGTRKLEAGG